MTVSPGAVPVTRTVSSSSSSSSSVATTEILSDEELDPAAIVIRNGSTSSKSLVSAESPASDTVTAVSVGAVPPSSAAVTVTVTGVSLSVTELGSTERFYDTGRIVIVSRSRVIAARAERNRQCRGNHPGQKRVSVFLPTEVSRQTAPFRKHSGHHRS